MSCETSEAALRIDLSLLGSDRKFILKCYKKGDFIQWKRKIEHAIDSSIGKKNNLAIKFYTDDISMLYNFWRFLRLPE